LTYFVEWSLELDRSEAPSSPMSQDELATKDTLYEVLGSDDDSSSDFVEEF
jgi:hypothetical protein